MHIKKKFLKNWQSSDDARCETPAIKGLNDQKKENNILSPPDFSFITMSPAQPPSWAPPTPATPTAAPLSPGEPPDDSPSPPSEALEVTRDKMANVTISHFPHPRAALPQPPPAQSSYPLPPQPQLPPPPATPTAFTERYPQAREALRLPGSMQPPTVGPFLSPLQPRLIPHHPRHLQGIAGGIPPHPAAAAAQLAALPPTALPRQPQPVTPLITPSRHQFPLGASPYSQLEFLKATAFQGGPPPPGAASSTVTGVPLQFNTSNVLRSRQGDRRRA